MKTTKLCVGEDVLVSAVQCWIDSLFKGKGPDVLAVRPTTYALDGSSGNFEIMIVGFETSVEPLVVSHNHPDGVPV